MTPPVDLRRRSDDYASPALFRSSDPAPTVDVGRGGPTVDGAEGPEGPVARVLPMYLQRAAYVEAGTASGQTAPESCTVPDPRAVDRIGAGTPTPTSPRPTAPTPDGAPRGPQVGISGVRRRPGIDALPAADTRGLGDAALADRLLQRATERYGNGDGLRVRIGDETLTMGQLRASVERDPERFADTLRRHGISVAEFNEVLDDALASEVPRGTVLDLREGSPLAQAYRIGGADGATVDVHYDRAATEGRAARQAAPETRGSLAGERVEGPGFFQMIADALAEAAAWIARLFGSTWNPDTATFNGRVDDAHFRQRGAEAARGPEGLTLQALMQQPDGAARLRQSLLAERPSSATERQWTRAVDDYLAGLRSGLADETRAGRLPTLDRAQSGEVLLYLRSQGFSAEARGHVERALAQPEPIRGQALHLLNELPDAERANLIAMLTPPAAERPARGAPAEAWRLHRAQSIMATGTPDERRALFETMRRDGFRHAPGSEAVGDVTQAIRDAGTVPESLRSRYLALIPELGIDRAHLANDFQYGVAQRLAMRSPTEGDAFLRDIEARVHSTDDLERALVGGSFRLQVTRPDAGRIASGDRAGVVRALEAHNVSFTLRSADGATPLRIVPRGQGDDRTISLDRYFRDAAYQAEVLRRTGLQRDAFEGMLTNVVASLASAGSEVGVSGAASNLADARRRLEDPTLSDEDRRSAVVDERFARLDLRASEAPQNLELDLSAGSRLDQLFGLRQAGVSSGFEAARATVIAGRDDNMTVTLRGPSGPRGRAGQTQTLTSAELADVLANPPSGQTSEQAFHARWPGLDYRETVIAFATLSQLKRSGQIESADDGSARIDLTARSTNADLNRLGARLRDGTRGNVPVPTTMGFDVASRSTADVLPADRVWSSSTTGAAAGNNFFQYGWFTFGGPSNGQGYFDTRAAETDARDRFTASGRRDPANVMQALYGLDRYTRIDGVERQYGTAVGQPDAFLRDPRSGLPARGQDFTLLTFTGSGSAAHRQAFERSAQRMEHMFTAYGGVPESQVERQSNPSPERMYAAIEAEITRDPRPAAERDRARTVVVYYAGHTHSDQADGVAGMAFTVNGRTQYFTPEMVARLTQLARERGVNLMWVTDACRAGEYASQPQAELARAAEASGRGSPELTSLTNLRGALRTYHQSLMAVHSLPATAMHAPMPGWRDLERLGRAALREGAAGTGSTTALDALRARRDAVLASPATSATEKRLMREYVAAVETMIQERGAVGRAGMATIAGNGVLTGATTWAPDRGFKTQQLGLLEDQLMAAIRDRTPAIQPASP